MNTKNSVKSADPILHRESPHLNIRSNGTDDFKNLKKGWRTLV
jgi:hypothetical protein